MKYYLAIDIGASSGRHILAHLKDGEILFEEIYRFDNRVMNKNDSLLWDIDYLLENIICGLKKCKKIGKIPIGVGIDTFGVDYVLLNKEDNIIGDIYSYRDKRTIEAKRKFSKVLNSHEQYELTGIQPQVYNTLYQLYSDKLNQRLKNVSTILLLPSFLNYYLTGIKRNEYTISTTTGIIDITTKDWNEQILKHLDIARTQLPKIIMPGQVLGNFTEAIQKQVGFNTNVYVIPSHDTASAVTGSLADKDTIFLSSGTWSLMGILMDKPLNTKETLALGFTNEGNYNGQYRFLKNIMGLWIIQEVRHEIGDIYTFSELVDLARENSNYEHTFNVNDELLLAPQSMISAIKAVLNKENKQLPSSFGELCYCIFNSLAKEYQKTVNEIEKITKKQYQYLNIFGGGCKNRLLNKLTEKYTGKKVITGPVEATALGNIVIQMLASNEIKSDIEIKTIINSSI
jgi:rhamnulokinase